MLGDHILDSYDFFDWEGVDIKKRFLTLITIGRVKVAWVPKSAIRFAFLRYAPSPNYLRKYEYLNASKKLG